jgi:hypothetical protein
LSNRIPNRAPKAGEPACPVDEVGDVRRLAQIKKNFRFPAITPDQQCSIVGAPTLRSQQDYISMQTPGFARVAKASRTHRKTVQNVADGFAGIARRKFIDESDKNSRCPLDSHAFSANESPCDGKPSSHSLVSFMNRLSPHDRNKSLAHRRNPLYTSHAFSSACGNFTLTEKKNRLLLTL